MIIKYTVWEYVRKPGKKKKQVFEHGEIEFPCKWEDGEDHSELRQAIYAKHPGKSLVGYCPEGMWETFIDNMNENNPEIILKY